MATKHSVVEVAAMLTTDPGLAQSFPSIAAADAFAASAAEKYSGTWERKMLKKICIEAQPPRAPFPCPKHYYTTSAAIAQATAPVDATGVDVVGSDSV